MSIEYKQLSFTAEEVDSILTKAKNGLSSPSAETWDDATKQAVRAALGLSFNADGSIVINGQTIKPLGTTKF